MAIVYYTKDEQIPRPWRMYYVTAYHWENTAPITLVEVTRVTPHTVWVFTRGRQAFNRDAIAAASPQKRASHDRAYLHTFAEARDWLADRLAEQVRDAEADVREAKKELADAKARLAGVALLIVDPAHAIDPAAEPVPEVSHA